MNIPSFSFHLYECLFLCILLQVNWGWVKQPNIKAFIKTYPFLIVMNFPHKRQEKPNMMSDMMSGIASLAPRVPIKVSAHH